MLELAGGGGAQQYLTVLGPSGVAVDLAGDLFVTDTNDHVVELLKGSGEVRTLPFTDLYNP